MSRPLIRPAVPVAVLLTAASGCAARRAEIPAPPPGPLPSAHHRLRVALPPLRDAREVREAPDGAGAYVYRGELYRGTNLDWLRPSPMNHLTRRFAQALLQTGVFAELVLVESADAAARADLVLTGSVRRARGYVQRDPAQGADPWVLGEVVLDELELRDARTGAVRVSGGTGWSIWEQRPAPADPWAVLADALDRATAELSQVLVDADLKRFEVANAVRVPRPIEPPVSPAAATPDGWRHAVTSTASAPRGWTGAARCRREALAQQQALRFHRILGPYRPEVVLWRCPSDVRLRWSPRVELPAVLMGSDDEGRWWFGSALGQSNWPEPLAQLTEALALAPPPPYVIELTGAEAPKAAEPTPIPSPRRRTDRPAPQRDDPPDAPSRRRAPVRPEAR